MTRYRAGDLPGAAGTLLKARQLPGGQSVDYDLFLAMAAWQTGAKDQARKLYDSVVKWMAQNSAQVDNNLRHLRAEAADVLGIKDEPAPKQEKGPKD
jgi:hypothetical protein